MNEIAVIDEKMLPYAELKISEAQSSLSVELTIESVEAIRNISIDLSKVAKAMEAKRQEYVRPALEEQKRINAAIKPTIDKLDELSKKILNRVNTFIKREERKEIERLAVIAKENAEKLLAGKEPEKVEIAKPSPLPKVSETKYWDYELTDFNKVPKEYLTLDNVKIMEAIRAGKREITGLYISQKTRPRR